MKFESFCHKGAYFLFVNLVKTKQNAKSKLTNVVELVLGQICCIVLFTNIFYELFHALLIVCKKGANEKRLASVNIVVIIYKVVQKNENSSV